MGGVCGDTTRAALMGEALLEAPLLARKTRGQKNFGHTQHGGKLKARNAGNAGGSGSAIAAYMCCFPSVENPVELRAVSGSE